MARLRWAFTASTTRDMTTRSRLARERSFIFGSTKTAHGKLHGSSVMTTMRRRSKGARMSQGYRGWLASTETIEGRNRKAGAIYQTRPSAAREGCQHNIRCTD